MTTSHAVVSKVLAILLIFSFTGSGVAVAGKRKPRAKQPPPKTAQQPVPKEIVFPDGKKFELPVLGKIIIKAYVNDANGNRIKGANVTWSHADPDLKSFVDVGPNENKDGVNSVQITWLAGKPELKAPSEVKLVATSGEAHNHVVLEYKAPKPEVVKITSKPDKLTMQPGDSETITVEIRGDKDRLIDDVELKPEIADKSAQDFIKVLALPDKKTLQVLALHGTPQKTPPPVIDTVLIVRAAGGVALIPIVYKRDVASVKLGHPAAEHRRR